MWPHVNKTQVIQAQTDPTAGSAPGGRRQGYTCIADQARQLRATVLSGKAFGLWLERQEAKRAAAQGGGSAGARAAAAAAAAAASGGKGEAPARPLISRGQRAATSRFKSQEHPRVVMKDLDGLEPDRVQVSGRGRPLARFWAELEGRSLASLQVVRVGQTLVLDTCWRSRLHRSIHAVSEIRDRNAKA